MLLGVGAEVHDQDADSAIVEIELTAERIHDLASIDWVQWVDKQLQP